MRLASVWPAVLLLTLALPGCPHPPPAQTLPLQPTEIAQPLVLPPPVPERWLGGPPVTAEDIAGKVTLLEVWTFACEHCRASHPWVIDLRRRFPELAVLAVHTPQTSKERDPARVAAMAREHHVDWPIYIDTDARYFETLRAEGWPTFVLIDRGGRMRARTLGRAELGRPRARGIEAAIKTLLSEP